METLNGYQQLDLLDLIYEPPLLAAPLHFTLGHYPAADLHAAFDEWCRLQHNFDSINRSHMWSSFGPTHNSTTGLHSSEEFGADLGCQHDRRDNCYCVKSYLSRIVCQDCDWSTNPHSNSQDAVEEYLDHCWPGWRELPVVTSTMNSNGTYTFHLGEDYPEEWTVPGAPVRECRGPSGFTTRHVPGGSPFGGYKTAVTRQCTCKHHQ